MFSIFYFIVSALILVALFAVRIYELKKERATIWGKFTEKSDSFFESVWYKGRIFGKIALYAIVVSFKSVGPEVRGLYLIIKRQMKNRFKIIFDILRGKKNLTKKGAASFYLKQISEDTKK